MNKKERIPIAPYAAATRQLGEVAGMARRDISVKSRDIHSVLTIVGLNGKIESLLQIVENHSNI